jgi:hypothetical protein
MDPWIQTSAPPHPSANLTVTTGYDVPKPRVGPERRRALQLLADVGQSGATQAIMLAHGFQTAMLAGMVKAGFVTEAIDTVRAGARMIDVRRLRITEAGRKALADALRRF